MAAKRKALVLSGGGGRGAYHVGAIEALVEAGWMEDGQGPDIIAGTSIGAINAAAIASGLTVADLQGRWLNMHSEDVHRLSADLPGYIRPFLRFFLRSVLTSEARGGDSENLAEEEREISAGNLLERMQDFFVSRPFRSLLDTAPWRHTLSRWMDFERINSAASPALLLTATELQSGMLRVFCNHDLQGVQRDTIGIEHLLASSSIPLVYPWTEIGAGKYWDGAVLANTPLGPVIDLAGGEDVEIIVVMMTPWAGEPEDLRAQGQQMPQDVVQALSLTLDWALLASYRTAFKLIRRYNELVDAAEKLDRAAEQTGDGSLRMSGPLRRRIAEPIVVAPQELMPLEWIVDYEVDQHRSLFALGKQDALAALSRAA